jgi:hypothetical protein
MSLAGCLDTIGITETLQLNGIILVNALPSAQSLAVLVQREGTIVYWSQHDLAGGLCTSAVITPTWQPTAADFGVAVRLNDRDTWTQTSLVAITILLIESRRFARGVVPASQQDSSGQMSVPISSHRERR